MVHIRSIRLDKYTCIEITRAVIVRIGTETDEILHCTFEVCVPVHYAGLASPLHFLANKNGSSIVLPSKLHKIRGHVALLSGPVEETAGQ